MISNFTSIVNDQANINDLNRSGLPNRLLTTLAAATNLHNANIGDSNLYYICTATATSITLPQNYAVYKGKFLHFINQVSPAGVVNAVQENTTPATAAGALYGNAGTKLNGAGVGQLLATNAVSATYTTLVCDGLTGWYYVMTG